MEFFLVSFLFFCIGAVQFILYNINVYQGGTILNQFVDLCTIANISLVLIMKPVYGYYLHAKSPWRCADIPLDWLQEMLDSEASGRFTEKSRQLPNNNRNSTAL